MNPQETVTAFCNALSHKTIDEALAYLAEDCLYHNIPLDPVTGMAAIRATLQGFFDVLGPVRIETLRQVGTGDWVMNERLDHFAPPQQGKAYALPVAGSFQVRNGKITIWNDYFDMQQLSRGTGIKF